MDIYAFDKGTSLIMVSELHGQLCIVAQNYFEHIRIIAKEISIILESHAVTPSSSRFFSPFVIKTKSQKPSCTWTQRLKQFSDGQKPFKEGNPLTLCRVHSSTESTLAFLIWKNIIGSSQVIWFLITILALVTYKDGLPNY